MFISEMVFISDALGAEHVEKFTTEHREKRLQKGLAEREQVNEKLKNLLKDEKTAAEKLRTEVQR